MKYGLLGKNISYSLSPLIYEYWFNIYDIKHQYELIDTQEISIELIKDIFTNNYTGINLTQPFKQDILDLNLGFKIQLDEISTKLKSLNNLHLKENKIMGYNTDYLGLKESFEHYKINLNNKRILLLGLGSTGNLLYELLKNYNSEIILYNRTEEKIKKLSSIGLSTTSYKEDISNKSIDIIINSTSISIKQILEKNHELLSYIQNNSQSLKYIYDVNYRYSNKELLSLLNINDKYDKYNKIQIINGLYMLLSQAIYNFN